MEDMSPLAVNDAPDANRAVCLSPGQHAAVRRKYDAVQPGQGDGDPLPLPGEPHPDSLEPGDGAGRRLTGGCTCGEPDAWEHARSVRGGGPGKQRVVRLALRPGPTPTSGRSARRSGRAYALRPSPTASPAPTTPRPCRPSATASATASSKRFMREISAPMSSAEATAGPLATSERCSRTVASSRVRSRVEAYRSAASLERHRATIPATCAGISA